MACKSGPNIGKASLIFSMDGATPRGFSSVDNEIEDRGRGRNRRRRRKCGISGGSGRDKSKGRGSFSMDGSNDFISVPIDSDDDMSAFSNFTFLAWIYPTTSANFWILSKGIEGDNDDSEFGLYLNSDGKAEVIIYDQSEEKFTKSITANALAANKWHFIAATYNGSNLQVSANLLDKGANQASTVAIENTDTQVYIGRSHGNNFANGFISSVYMYDEALSDREISDFYIATKSKFKDVATPVAGTGTGDEDVEVSEPSFKFTVVPRSSIVFTNKNGQTLQTGYSNYLDLSETNSVNINFDGTLIEDVYGGNSDYNANFQSTTFTHNGETVRRFHRDWGSSSGVKTIELFGHSGEAMLVAPGAQEVLPINGWGHWSNGRTLMPSYIFKTDRNIDVGTMMPSGNSFSQIGWLYRAGFHNGPYNLNDWDITNITSLNRVFQWGRGFNQPLGNWDTSNVTDMYQTFLLCGSFDQDIGNWDVSNVTTMHQTFRNCTVFNNGGSSSIGNWDTSSVTTMNGTFTNCQDFNQDIGSWDTSSCSDFTSTFYNCYDFDQDLSSWDFRAIDSETRLTNFMYGCTLSTANYNALLVRLKNQVDDMDFNGDDVVVNFGSSTHSGAGTSARSYLISEHDWTITDGGSA
jgi:surface protein